MHANETGHLLQAALVVLSDVHMQHLADKRARLLLDLCARLSPEVEYFVLNGDIFDFCFGGSDYFRRKFRPFGQALADVASRGTQVVFVEGNHEFHIAEIGWSGVKIVTERDLALVLHDGTRVKISHGDLITDDPLYRAFRNLVKSKSARFGANFIPGGWLDAYSLRHAKVSRAQDKYRRLEHGKILQAAFRWATGAEYGIIGHFHVPYAEPKIDGGLLLSVESWDNPNALIYKDGGFFRTFLHDIGAPFVLEPAQSLFKAGRA